MKKIKFLPKLLVLGSLLAGSVSFAQTSTDTVKTGKANDPMVIDPGLPNDNGVINPGKANDEGVINPGNTNDDMAALTDSGFINKNIMDNTMEIKLAKLGRDKGTSSAVKKAATVMITDHTAILNDLKKLAAKKQTGSKGAQMDDISKMPPLDTQEGGDFDSKWASAMLTMHEAKIDELEKFMSATHDAAIKAAVGKALPKIKAHAAMLQKIPGAKVTQDPNSVIH